MPKNKDKFSGPEYEEKLVRIRNMNTTINNYTHTDRIMQAASYLVGGYDHDKERREGFERYILPNLTNEEVRRAAGNKMDLNRYLDLIEIRMRPHGIRRRRKPFTRDDMRTLMQCIKRQSSGMFHESIPKRYNYLFTYRQLAHFLYAGGSVTAPYGMWLTARITGDTSLLKAFAWKLTKKAETGDAIGEPMHLYSSRNADKALLVCDHYLLNPPSWGPPDFTYVKFAGNPLSDDFLFL